MQRCRDNLSFPWTFSPVYLQAKSGNFITCTVIEDNFGSCELFFPVTNFTVKNNKVRMDFSQNTLRCKFEKCENNTNLFCKNIDEMKFNMSVIPM